MTDAEYIKDLERDKAAALRQLSEATGRADQEHREKLLAQEKVAELREQILSAAAKPSHPSVQRLREEIARLTQERQTWLLREAQHHAWQYMKAALEGIAAHPEATPAVALLARQAICDHDVPMSPVGADWDSCTKCGYHFAVVG